METEETSPPRESLEEKKSQERPGDDEKAQKIETCPPQDGDTSTTDESPRDAPAAEKEYEYITGLKLVLVILAVTLACFLMLLDNSILSTAIPRITSDFNSLNDIGWYGSAYLIAACALQPLAGKIYSQFSTKYTFMSFVAVFELGSLLCGAAQSSKMLIVGRAVAGLGGAGIQNGALTIISAAVPLYKRAAYLGFMMAFVQLGVLLGPLIGGLLTEYASWRWCFYINLPIGGVALLFILFINIPQQHTTTKKHTFRSIYDSLDIPGFCLFAPAAIQFLLALEWGGSVYRWNSAMVIGLFCGSAGTLAVFLAWEYKRGDTAMIPLSMLKRRVVWSSCLTMFFTFANMITTTYYLAIYFQAVKGDSPTMSGVSTLPTILSQILLAIISGVLVGRLGYYLPWTMISGSFAAVASGLLSTLKPDSSIGRWIGYQIIGGASRGCGMQMPLVAIQNNLEPELSPIAMAILVFSQTFGGALFLSFAQTAFSNGLKDGLHRYAPEVDAGAVINAGATGFRALVGKSSLDGVILAYNQAVSHVFYLAAGCAVCAFVFCLGMGWKNIKKPKVAAASEA